MGTCVQQNAVTIGFHQRGETPFTRPAVSPTSMVESTVILSARIAPANWQRFRLELAFCDFGPIAKIQSAATAEIEIKQ